MKSQKEMVTNVTPQAVRAQVARILASEAFNRSPRMQRFLEFVVEETLEGRDGQLGEYAIGTAVFDRGEDFEPAVDPIVRNDARRLRIKLLEYYRSESGSVDPIWIDIPKGGYVPVFRTVPPPPEPSTPSKAPRRLAVLPFEVLSAAPEGAMHGRALCLSLTANLTNVEGLEAVAHGYLQDGPLRQAASELNLSHAIHGSLMRSHDQCRVTINLIHIASGAQIWAREYDFRSDEVLAAQSEITRTVRREVTARLGLRQPEILHLAKAA